MILSSRYRGAILEIRDTTTRIEIESQRLTRLRVPRERNNEMPINTNDRAEAEDTVAVVVPDVLVVERKKEGSGGGRQGGQRGRSATVTRG